MAKSLFQIIETGLIEVNHNGDDMEFSITEWLKKASGKLENKEELVLWAEETGKMHALLHAGIAKTIIDLRATIRPADITGAEKGSKEKVSLIADYDNAQKRADIFTIKPTTRPGTGGKTPEQRSDKALKLLNSLTPEMRAAVMAQAQA